MTGKKQTKLAAPQPKGFSFGESQTGTLSVKEVQSPRDVSTGHVKS